jgi:ABC-type Fe3+-hydroxamate transport system substrate-binding protein
MQGSSAIILVALLFSTPAFAWNRIITLNPMISEWTAEILGREISLKKIVGAAEFSSYPEFMKKVETIGPYPQIQPEKIIALKPDLIIASPEYNRTDQLDQLRKLKLNLVNLPKEKFSNMGDWITVLGGILGEEKRAKEVALQWNRALAELKPIRHRKKVFFQIQFQPLITVGAESFLNTAFGKVGYDNIFADLPQAYPKVSKEAVLERNPAEIFVFEMVKNQDDLEKVKNTWSRSVVRVFNGDDFARCSLRLLKALKEVALNESK